MRKPTFAGLKAQNNAVYNKRDIKLAIDAFMSTYTSQHSAMALSLPILINYCQEKGISYQLTACPNVEYSMQVICSMCCKPMEPKDDNGGDCRKCIRDREKCL